MREALSLAQTTNTSGYSGMNQTKYLENKFFP